MNYIKRAERELVANIYFQYIKYGNKERAKEYAKGKGFDEFDWNLVKELKEKQAN